MRSLLVFLTFACVPLLALGQTVQHDTRDIRDITVSLTLGAEPSSCLISTVGPLDFGTVLRPSDPASSGRLEWNSATGMLTNDQIGQPVNPQIGTFNVEVQANSPGTLVSIEFPQELAQDPNIPPISFEGNWAQSDNDDSDFALIGGLTYTFPSGGTFTHYFRYGGIVDGIQLNDPGGLYQGIGTIQIACPN